MILEKARVRCYGTKNGDKIELTSMYKGHTIEQLA